MCTVTAQLLQCKVYSVLCNLYRLLCTAYCVPCSVYCVQCTVYIIQCTLYYVRMTMCSKCSVSPAAWINRQSAQWPGPHGMADISDVFTVHCTVYSLHSVQYTVYSVHCTVYSLHSVQCTLLSLQCTVLSVWSVVCSVQYIYIILCIYCTV